MRARTCAGSIRRFCLPAPLAALCSRRRPPTPFRAKSSKFSNRASNSAEPAGLSRRCGCEIRYDANVGSAIDGIRGPFEPNHGHIAESRARFAGQQRGEQQYVHPTNAEHLRQYAGSAGTRGETGAADVRYAITLQQINAKVSAPPPPAPTIPNADGTPETAPSATPGTTTASHERASPRDCSRFLRARSMRTRWAI